MNTDEDISALVRRYAKAAAAHGRATERGDSNDANAAYRTLVDVYWELRRRGVNAQRALLPLLEDSDVGVQVWAGSHSLEFSPDDGERALTRVAALPGLIAFSAKMTLQEWRRGKLHFDS